MICPLSMIGAVPKNCNRDCMLWASKEIPPRCLFVLFIANGAASMYKQYEGMMKDDELIKNLNQPRKLEDKDVT